MDKYFIEYSINPPFLERCYQRINPLYKSELLPVRSCCAIYIRAIESLDSSDLPDSLSIKGYQENSHARYYNIDLNIKFKDGKNKDETRIITHGCFDLTVLYVIAHIGTEKKFFVSEFYGCRMTRNGVILLNEMRLFTKNTFFKIKIEPSYKFTIKTLNYKSKDEEAALHYNWAANQKPKIKNPCLIELLGLEYTLEHIRCVFCFKLYTTVENLCQHINTLHYNYRAKIEKREDSVDKLKILRIYYQEMIDPTNFLSSNEEVIEGVTYLRAALSEISEDSSYKKDFVFCKKRTQTKTRTGPIASIVTSRFRTKEFDADPNNQALEFRYYHARKLSEIVDLKPRQIDLMVQWNDFIYLKKLKGRLPPIFSLASEFLTEFNDRNTLLDFLIVFYQKGLLGKAEILKLITKQLELSHQKVETNKFL
ncbi:hypothetical protein M153_7140002256 [Pseudoloma neurophilia]|uniref:C2H2-type domain-containing protein n=1 Tax=Pseudoloma neurophilia TaxID=146866 RepID=A0A0R0M0E1_9MICR|nr:hypothetical protein M153_7140002256 [Pseudoloma neurophilia]